MLRSKIDQIRQAIEKICRKKGRNPVDIRLVAVTKYAALNQIRAAIDAGLTDIGESRIQDAQKKFAELEAEGRRFTRHMIGHLQTNKVKQAVSLFDLIQSVDSLRLIREIDRRAKEVGREVPILIEVNTSKEDQKFGVQPEGVFALIDEIRNQKNIIFQGLMTVAVFSDRQEDVRACFRQLAALGQQIRQRYTGESRIDMRYLSMGMTHDYELALEEGANMLRIGSAIFA